MQPGDRGVQFCGLAEAHWRSESDNAANARDGSGSTVDAIVGTRTAARRAGAWGGGEQHGRRMRDTDRRARRCGKITVITSVRTERGSQFGE